MTKSLTEGKPFSIILEFSIPVFFGYLFQQFYNVTDTVIVGKALGVGALAAVGATGAVNFLIIGFVVGVCSGFSIPLAQRFGAQDFSAMRKYVANSAYLCIVFSVAMTFVTVVFCKPFLFLMHTPHDIVDAAASYIRIIFGGIPFIFLYNIIAAIMRSLGDSKTPLFFLVFSSLLNIALDLIFILVFSWGIQGAALATVIAQGVAGVVSFFYMRKKYDIIRASVDERKISLTHCKSLCGSGIPMGLQYSITAIGCTILQTAVNGLGSAAVAACTSAEKITMFFATVFDSLGTTMATYGGQNAGAGKLDRLSSGLKSSLIISSVYSMFILLVCVFAGQYFIMLFMDAGEIEIISRAKLYLTLNVIFYIPLACVNIFRFMIQGMGYSAFAIIAGVMEMIARMFMGMIVVPRLGFVAAGLGSPVAWVAADCFLIPAFIYCKKRLSRSFEFAKKHRAMKDLLDSIDKKTVLN